MRAHSTHTHTHTHVHEQDRHITHTNTMSRSPGDLLVAVGNASTAGMTLETLIPHIQGPVGSVVQLTMARGQQRFIVQLRRDNPRSVSVLLPGSCLSVCLMHVCTCTFDSRHMLSMMCTQCFVCVQDTYTHTDTNAGIPQFMVYSQDRRARTLSWHTHTRPACM